MDEPLSAAISEAAAETVLDETISPDSLRAMCGLALITAFGRKLVDQAFTGELVSDALTTVAMIGLVEQTVALRTLTKRYLARTPREAHKQATESLPELEKLVEKSLAELGKSRKSLSEKFRTMTDCRGASGKLS